MAKLRAGIIGCGGRGNAHAFGYNQSDKVEIAACADVHLPAAERMAGAYGFSRTYTDYREMLAEESLDVVSMALWPELHCEAVLACLDAPSPPRLINAEKPMAPTFGECVRMHEACEAAGVMLTFSHQRRFGRTFSLPLGLLREGAIGTLQRLEMNCSNLFDWGTHWFDMMLFYNDDLDADWVMGQIDCAEDRRVFGAQVETAGISYVKWPNGVTGLLTTGAGTGSPCQIRVIGSGGMIDLDHRGVRVLREGESWQAVAPILPPVPGEDTTRHLLDSIECALDGRCSTLCSENALRATELIFATYESARRRQRVLLPLETDDSALLTMIGTGELVIPDWPAYVTEDEERAGHALLFNGRDLAGWTSVPSAAWSASGGIVRGSRETPGVLRTEEVFGDFSLRFAFRLGSRSAAELLLRAGGDGDGGLAIPLLDDRMEPVSVTSTGAVKGVVAPAENPRVGGSSWSVMEVTCEGRRVTVTVGDAEILTCDVAEYLGPEGVPGSGCIGLRTLSGWADFRDILVRRLG